jgi:TonB family protein
MYPTQPRGQFGGPPAYQPERQGCWGRNWKWLVPVGCFGLIVLVVAAAAAVFFVVMSAVKSSEVYQFALEKARSNPTVVGELGEPIKDGWLVQGSVETSGASDHAKFQIPISGPKKSGTIYAEALKDPQVAGGSWYYTTLSVEVEGRPDRVDLRGRVTSPPTPGTVADNNGNADAGLPPPPPFSSNRAPVSGGVLNDKAVSKPEPAYPPVARAAKASGTVTVQVTVDESGKVISATAVSGHPLLQAAAVAAARQAKFAPTKLDGSPVKVTGVLTYNFVPE